MTVLHKHVGEKSFIKTQKVTLRQENLSWDVFTAVEYHADLLCYIYFYLIIISDNK